MQGLPFTSIIQTFTKYKYIINQSLRCTETLKNTISTCNNPCCLVQQLQQEPQPRKQLVMMYGSEIGWLTRPNPEFKSFALFRGSWLGSKTRSPSWREDGWGLAWDRVLDWADTGSGEIIMLPPWLEGSLLWLPTAWRRCHPGGGYPSCNRAPLGGEGCRLTRETNVMVRRS